MARHSINKIYDISSFISGISLLGTPTEIYVYGVQYMFVVIGVISMGFAMTYIYLPVFHGLQLTSTYQVSVITELDRNQLCVPFAN